MATAGTLQPTTPLRLRPEEKAGGGITTRDILNSLFYYRRIAALIAGSIIALGIVAALLFPPRYTAEARLLTLNAGYYDIRPDRAGGGAPAALDPAEVVNVEMQLLASSELHRQVVREDLGAGATASQIDSELLRFEKKLHITKVEAANVIELTFSDRDPVHAADMLRRLLTVYFRERGGVLTSGRVTFLTAQRDKVKAQLDRANSQIAAYQAKNNVVDVQAQISSAVALDGLLRQNKLDADTTLAQTSGSLARLRSDAGSVPRTVELYSDSAEKAQAVGTMQTNLMALQARRADLGSRYMAGSPFLTQLDQQIASLKTSIAERTKDLLVSKRVGYNAYADTVRDRVMQADAQVASQASRRAALDQQIAASTNRLQGLITVSDTLERLRVQRDILVDSYKNFATQVAQAAIQQNEATTTGSTNVRVIEAPVPPTDRSNPPLLLLAGSVVAALVIAGGAVFMLSSVRETFLSPQEAERTLRIPVLSAPLQDDDAVPAPHDYGRLITAIDKSSDARAKVILLVASRLGDGLEDLSRGLSNALERRSPNRVVTVEVEGGPAAQIDHATALPATVGRDGTSARVAAWWINRSGNQLVEELRQSYDYILLLAPPMAASAEGVEMASLADAVVLMIRAEVTRKPVAEDLIAQINAAGTPVAGLAMSGRKRYIPTFIYRLL